MSNCHPLSLYRTLKTDSPNYSHVLYLMLPDLLKYFSPLCTQLSHHHTSTLPDAADFWRRAAAQGHPFICTARSSQTDGNRTKISSVWVAGYHVHVLALRSSRNWYFPFIIFPAECVKNMLLSLLFFLKNSYLKTFQLDYAIWSDGLLIKQTQLPYLPHNEVLYWEQRQTQRNKILFFFSVRFESLSGHVFKRKHSTRWDAERVTQVKCSK